MPSAARGRARCPRSPAQPLPAAAKAGTPALGGRPGRGAAVWAQGCTRGAGDKELGGGGAGGRGGPGSPRLEPVPGRRSEPSAAAGGGGGCRPSDGSSAGRAGVLPACPGLRCQGERFAGKLLQGMTQPGSASVLAVGGGRASAVQKLCVFTNVVLPLPRLFTWSCSRGSMCPVANFPLRLSSRLSGCSVDQCSLFFLTDPQKYWLPVIQR